jgi:hypothetical protein
MLIDEAKASEGLAHLVNAEENCGESAAAERATQHVLLIEFVFYTYDKHADIISDAPIVRKYTNM